MDQISSQVAIAAATSFALQWLKKQSWFPWVTMESGKLNRIVSVFIAFLSGFGIYVTWDHTAGALTITGLTTVHLLHAGSKVFQQFMFQQLTYKMAIEPKAPAVVPPAVILTTTK